MPRDKNRLLLHKRIYFYERESLRKASFVTDGALYFFPSNADLFDSCIYAICDYFNAFPIQKEEVTQVFAGGQGDIARLLALEISGDLL
jgi:hypothetical protein